MARAAHQAKEKLEVTASREELTTLDTLSSGLSTKIGELRQERPQFDRKNPTTQLALHEMRYSSLKGYEELAHHCYGRTVLGVEIDEDGRQIAPFTYRITQANVGYIDKGCFVLARNSPIASRLVSADPGDEIEVNAPRGMRFLVAEQVRTFDGPVSLLSPTQKPNFRSMMIRRAASQKPLTVQNLRAFIGALTAVPSTVSADRVPHTPEPRAPAPVPPTTIEPNWIDSWQGIYLGDSETSSLGHQFFTRTTREQESALNNPRGLTFVEGVAGAGKTSVALGRLKFFANFGTGEQREHYGLQDASPNDFSPVGMVGFVLSHSLKRYLRETAVALGLERLPIRDFQEFRTDLLNQFGLARKFKRSRVEISPYRTRLSWLRAIDTVVARVVGARLDEAIARTPDLSPSVRQTGQKIAASLKSANVQNEFHLSRLARRIIADIMNAEFRAREASINDQMRRETNYTIREDLRRSLARIEQEEERKVLTPLARQLLPLLNVVDFVVPAVQLEEFPNVVHAAFGESINQIELDKAVASLRALVSEQDEEKRRSLTDADLAAFLAVAAMIADDFEYPDAPTHFYQVRRSTAVFIDEVQDFTEIEILLMGMVTTHQYHQITLSGDRRQRLQSMGAEDYANLFPSVPRLSRNPQIFLDHNFRQENNALALLSAGIRCELQGDTRIAPVLDNDAPASLVHVFRSRPMMADLMLKRIQTIDAYATIAVICPSEHDAKDWYELLHEELAAFHRPALLSHRDDLTRRVDVHFTEVRETKGLEFDVVIVPDIGAFQLSTDIGRNQLYVAVSRPRHALLLGCDHVAIDRPELKMLIAKNLLRPNPISAAALN